MLAVLRGVFRALFVCVLLAGVGGGAFAYFTLARFSRDLPDYQQLVNYVPAIGSKVYASDGTFLIEFEKEHRIPVAIDKIPKVIIEAFLAAEDRDFYKHNGVEPTAVFRAALADVLRLHRGQRPIGASTITQQVVRHFLLTNEVSVARKIKEMMLAYRIEHTLSKDRILEIYLNEIYLGAGSYGVAAAADTYFQKPLDQLTLGEAAFIAALPKAPNNYNPMRHPAAARTRRDWVLAGMAEVGWITQDQAKAAMAEPLDIHIRNEVQPGVTAGTENDGYFVEEVRRELVARFGEKAVYEGGLTVRTSYVPTYQQMAVTAFRNGLVEYDRRHGWRGPIAHLPTGAAAQVALLNTPDPPGPDGWQLAAVTGIDARSGATIALKNGGTGHIPFSEVQWARKTLADQQVGAGVRSVRDVLEAGDIVLVEPASAAEPEPSRGGRHAAATTPVATYALRQIPDVSGGVVVMDPKTGRVLALVGGWSFRQSQFDRATQAMRQPGSSFKPFVYVTALENGFSPGSTVDDSPISISQGPGLPPWQPVNYESGYVGATTLEDALVHSRNMATVHVAQSIGLKPIAKTVEDFGVLDRMPLYYSMVLGSGETTLMRMTTAYSMLDNGGHWLLPSLIDTVQDRGNRILYQKGVAGCAACFVAGGARNSSDENSLYHASGPADPSTIWLSNASYADGAMVYKPTKQDPLVTPQADYQIISMMQGVIQHGTGIEVAKVGKPLAGKTGTTSDWFDAWFVGFSPDIATGVFVGFDEPRTLGNGEVGGHVAAPIFRDFMMAALKDKPATPFPVPEGVSPEIASASSSNGGANGNGDKDDDDEADMPNGGGANNGTSAMLGPGPGGMNPNAASQDDDDQDDGANAPGPNGPGANGPGANGPGADIGNGQNRRGAMAYTTPPPSWRDETPASERDNPNVPQSSRGYGPVPRDPNYAASGVAPSYPVPWGAPPVAAPWQAAPRGYGAPVSPYPAPGAPPYPPPPGGWAVRPSSGTGGLY